VALVRVEGEDVQLWITDLRLRKCENRNHHPPSMGTKKSSVERKVMKSCVCACKCQFMLCRAMPLSKASNLQCHCSSWVYAELSPRNHSTVIQAPTHNSSSVKNYKSSRSCIMRNAFHSPSQYPRPNNPSIMTRLQHHLWPSMLSKLRFHNRIQESLAV
jgi:hypothetical protein